ncbi:dodecin [Methylocaldum sp. MU1018]|jgi:flavin-binding protein dodecin
MTDRVYKLVEIVGTSPRGTDEAIRNAIEKASKTIKNLDWFQVVETRGQIADGKIAHYQVVLKIGFRIEE